MPSRTPEPRPFLKWAGGKRQLLPELRRYYPDGISHYIEPFLGSGAVFFDLWNLGRLRDATVTLADENGDLIGCYMRVRDSLASVMSVLSDLADGHSRDARAQYYCVRDERFNPQRRLWQQRSGKAVDYPAELAAMLIYLNRTGYNGLFRLNARGEFNVPAGRYARPTILDVKNLTAVANVLGSSQVRVVESPFEESCRNAAHGAVIYFDPPYAPLSATANFRSYTARSFGDEDQRRLQQQVLRLARRGARILLSNSTAPSVCRLYEEDEDVARAGLRVTRVRARRSINARADRRGPIDELIVTNLSPAS